MDSLDERRARLADLNEKMRRCVACPLAKGRTKAVPGEGRIDAEIMLIGEAPGYYEDQQGRPFVGAAGQFLEQLLAGIGLKRTDVFIANVIKCRPPGNRDPLPDEIDVLLRTGSTQQIDIVQPKVIVTLGRYSLARFFPGTPISRIHGQGRKRQRGTLGRADVPPRRRAASGQPAPTSSRRTSRRSPRYRRSGARRKTQAAPSDRRRPPAEPVLVASEAPTNRTRQALLVLRFQTQAARHPPRRSRRDRPAT